MTRDGLQSSADHLPPGETVPNPVRTRGTMLGRYVILGLIGQGGLGAVYAAYDPELDRKVAIKILRGIPTGSAARKDRRTRLIREAKALARLSHPNIVSIFDIGTFEDQVFLAMEFVDGGTLRHWCEETKRSWREILQKFLAAGEGLAAAHAEGLLHRDFKPDNVMITRHGDVRVMDFGLVRRRDNEGSERSLKLLAGGRTLAHAPDADDRISGDEVWVGTPGYMAAEQFRGGTIDTRTDQYSFCVSLYECLYGQRPFTGSTAFESAEATVEGRVNGAPAGSDVPQWLRRAILRGLRPNPKDRYLSMHDLLSALKKAPAIRLRRGLAAAGGAAGASMLLLLPRLPRATAGLAVAGAALAATFAVFVGWAAQHAFSRADDARDFLARVEGGQLVLAWSVLAGGIGLALADVAGFAVGLGAAALALGTLTHRARRLIESGERP